MDCGNAQATIRSVSPESAPSGLKGDEDWSDNLEGIVSLLNNEPNTGSGHPTEGSEDSKTLAEQSSKGPASSSPVQTMASFFHMRQLMLQLGKGFHPRTYRVGTE